ncbi:MAG: hybrid sensor histidine kinase/response regulator [Sphingobacteriaceae bacterium]|nr:hybrid sensor histidine kinase/response regulator [Sphingobacteriaceae bacterium]
MMGKIAVLYIDDERHNLYAFRATFRLEYEVFIAESAEEARQLLRNHQIPIVIADQRMPKETGIEFFESIMSTHPQVMRILLTGYTDIQAVINAVNLGNVFRYLQKPWKEEEIRTAITQAYEIYQTRAQLVIKNKELELAYSELDKFVYSASHDMRSPLMSILGVVKLARMEGDFTNTKAYFSMIEESVERLDGFIKSIIDYYRNKRNSFHPSEIDFKDMVDFCIQNQLHLEETDLNFKINIDQKQSFVSDKLKLGIALSNLISNGIKYQDHNKTEKQVSIDIKVDAQKATIRIADNGIGIKEGEVEKIFRMFYRATNMNPGSGIGLYIVKDAVEQLAGSITVESIYGQGSTFELNIPNQSS